MVPFGVPIIIRHLIFRVPKKGPEFCQLPTCYQDLEHEESLSCRFSKGFIRCFRF